MMPVSGAAGAVHGATALGLGFVSAVFDNIPLTKLAHRSEWLRLRACSRYAVGLRRLDDLVRILAGVALASAFPHGSVSARGCAHGWHVALGSMSSVSRPLL